MMWPLILGLSGAFIFLRSIYRLFFHPLSHIPGPKLAAISHVYEFYYDVVLGGMYLWEIGKMHEKYGPVVRISPREIHIKDPYFYDEVYAPSARKRDKDPFFVNIFGLPLGLVSTVGHEHHRFRRGILNNFFSKKSVIDLSSVILEKQTKLRKRLEQACSSGAVLKLDDVYAALTADVISHYSWGMSSGNLDDENFSGDIRSAVNELVSAVHINRFFPILSALPPWIMNIYRPGTKSVVEMQNMITQSYSEKSGEGKQKTLFDALTDPSVPPEERTARRLQDEGLLVIIAGTETTARLLGVASYHIFRDRPLMLKLREEICTVMPTPTTEPSWSKLEHLPYLSAVINEALRVAHGPIFRSGRIAPTESLVYKDLVIPPDTPISMSAYFVHMDPKIFPEPESFKPERWIEATEKGEFLSRFLVAFSKGSRICLGLNLAYAELYMTLATIIRRFDVELFETGPNDVRIYREMGIGEPKEGTFRVRAKITKILIE